MLSSRTCCVRRALLALPLLLPLLFCGSAEAQAKSNAPAGAEPAAQAAANAFLAQQPGAWRLAWDKETGLVRSMYGGETEPLGPKPLEAAAAFVQRYGAMVLPQSGAGMKAPELVPAQQVETPAGTKVVFQQHINGLRAVKGLVSVLVNDAGCVTWAQSSALNVEPFSAKATLTPASASDRVQRALSAEGKVTVTAGPELVLWSRDEVVLAYEVFCTVGEAWNVHRVYVDANTGDILESRRLVFETKPESKPQTAPPAPAQPADPVLLPESSGMLQAVPAPQGLAKPAQVQPKAAPMAGVLPIVKGPGGDKPAQPAPALPVLRQEAAAAAASQKAATKKEAQQ